MNTPRSKPIIRWNTPRKKTKRLPNSPDGRYFGGLHNDEIAKYVTYIITILPHIEEQIIEIMALLMGDASAPARQVFRSLNSEEARVKVMRALLETTRHNETKGREFDEVIDLFVEIKNKRNAYAHGLWWTHEGGRVFLEEHSPDFTATFGAGARSS